MAEPRTPKLCPKCGDVLTIQLQNSLLCRICYLSAIRQVPRDQIVRAIKEFQDGVAIELAIERSR